MKESMDGLTQFCFFDKKYEEKPLLDEFFLAARVRRRCGNSSYRMADFQKKAARYMKNVFFWINFAL